MTPQRMRMTLIILTAVMLGVLVVPRITGAVRARRATQALEAEPFSRSILVDPGMNDPNYIQIGREGLVERMIATLAGDSPRRLGDLRIAPESTVAAPDRLEFTVLGEASFDQLYATMTRLRELWPAVRVSQVHVETSPEGKGLSVSLTGSLAPNGVVPVAVSLGPSPAPVSVPGRDPFTFASVTPAVPVQTRGLPDDRPASPLPPLPPFQGTGRVQGEAIAFFGGRAYRVGERVAGRLLETIENGRVRFAPTEDQR